MPLPFGPPRAVLRIERAERDALLGRRLAEIAARFDPRIFASGVSDRRPGAAAPAPAEPSLPDTIRLLVAPDEAAFRRASGGLFPDWGLAVAFPRERRIVLRPPRLLPGDVQDPGLVLVHELVHVYLAMSLGGSEAAAPRWFHEGLASLLAGEWGWGERFDLALALAARPPIPLESLERGFPADRQAASLAYLESLTAAAALRDLSGEEGLRVLVRNLRSLGDFDAALRRTYGLTYGEFEARWRDGLAGRYGWAAAAASSWTWWTPLAFLLVGLVVLRRVRYRSRLAELEREERLEVVEDGGGEPEWTFPESSGDEWKREDDAEGPPWDPRGGAAGG